jgi:hypothetical protein
MATPSEAIYVTCYDEERLRRTSALTQLAVKVLPKEEKTWDKVCSVCHARFPDEGDDVWRPGLCRCERRSL